MGASEMMFVGGFTVLCVGASAIVCKLAMADMKERLQQAKREMYYYKNERDNEAILKRQWKTQSDKWRTHYEHEKANNTRLKRQISVLQRNGQAQNSNPGLAGEEKTIMIKALKKAMFEAHPDRGGKQDEFIKINQLYKKLK